ncbi:hypothetical protein ABT282_29160 [Streptomyces sp. NPDC000927]|uniref:hypothetical protein n=1 Tax=Streptomyces sp. NPDC000927 TaxID=3154371 RepID=UPI003323C5B0
MVGAQIDLTLSVKDLGSGCHFTKTGTRYSNHPGLSLRDAAEAANAHATACRALPRDIPARPDDDAARERLRKWAGNARNRVEDQQLWIESLDLLRPTLQRTTDWIETALQQLADDEPDLLTIKRSNYSSHALYYARRS